MSRAGADVVTVKPSNNVYTALAAIATIANIVALVALFVKAKELFGDNGIF